MYLRNSQTNVSQLRKMADKLKLPLRAIITKDMLKHINPEIGGYIVNLQSSDQGSGSHWCALYLDKDKTPIYCDSFGIVEPLDVIDFVKRFTNKPIIRNKHQIQNINSGHCGQYCIYFLHMMSKCHGSATDKLKYFLDKFNTK